MTESQRETPIPARIESDEWRTWRRVLPRDVYEELKRFEHLVAEHSGLPPRFEGIGASVSVWSILCHCLRENEAELMILAQEWRDEQDSGTAADGTSKIEPL